MTNVTAQTIEGAGGTMSYEPHGDGRHRGTMIHPDCAARVDISHPNQARVMWHANVHDCNARDWANLETAAAATYGACPLPT